MLSRKLREEELRKIVFSVRHGNFPYQEKEDKEIDFVKYNKAQINEISDVLEMIRDVVNTASERLQKTIVARGPGQPPVPIDDVIKVLLMQSYSGVSYRDIS